MDLQVFKFKDSPYRNDYLLHKHTPGPSNLVMINHSIRYRIMGYFRVAKFSRFCLKNIVIIFRGF